MAAEPTRVHVPLGERAYDIVIGAGLLDGAGERLKAMFPGRRFGIVTDSEVAKAQLPRLVASLDAAGLSHARSCCPMAKAPSRSRGSARWSKVCSMRGSSAATW